MKDSVFFILSTTVVAVIILLLLAIAFEISLIKLDAKCADFGYASSKLTLFPEKRYCLKRVDQTDTIVLLEDLQKQNLPEQ